MVNYLVITVLAALTTGGAVVLFQYLALLLHPTSFNLANSLRAAGDVRCTIVVGSSVRNPHSLTNGPTG